MKVREAFEKAYGPLPGTVTGCYLGYSAPHEGVTICPVVRAEYRIYRYTGQCWENDNNDTEGPDIYDEDAYPFRNFFCKQFKTVVETEQEQNKLRLEGKLFKGDISGLGFNPPDERNPYIDKV